MKIVPENKVKIPLEMYVELNTLYCNLLLGQITRGRERCSMISKKIEIFSFIKNVRMLKII